MAEKLFAEANQQMGEIAAGLLRRGICLTPQQAVERACTLHGKDMAAALENSLRMMGAVDVKVTCP